MIIVVYKDKEREREYKQLWYLRKKAGLSTKLVNKPKTSFEKRKMQLERGNEKYRKSKQKMVDKVLGESCFLYGYSGKRRLHSHRKDGTKHKYFYLLSKPKLKIELESGEYVRLCYKCHKHIHWGMEFLGLTWKQMMEMRN